MSAKITIRTGLICCTVLCLAVMLSLVDIGRLTEPPELPVQCADFKWDAPVNLVTTSSSDEEQKARMYFHRQQMKRQIISMDSVGRIFFQRNWEPSYSCSVVGRMGCPGDGGKWVCDPHRVLSGSDCVVYSVGSNNDFSFEEAVHNFNPRCEIHTFDHTASQSKNTPSFLKFHPWRLGKHDSHSEFTVQSAMHRLGHQNISVLKVDCEGCELESFGESFPVAPGAIRQILVEVHFSKNPEAVHRLFKLFSDKGYAIFSKEPNIQYSNGDAVEFSLVHLGDRYY